MAKQKLPSIIVTLIILYLMNDLKVKNKKNNKSALDKMFDRVSMMISALIRFGHLQFKPRRPTGIRAESEELSLQPPPSRGAKSFMRYGV